MDNKIEQVEQAIMDSISHYYELLSKTGYVKQSTVDKLLILSFIGDIINDFPPIDEKDYNNLYKVWDCLASSSCLIPWADYQKYSGKKVTGSTSMRIRVSDNNIRVANNNLRTTQI